MESALNTRPALAVGIHRYRLQPTPGRLLAGKTATRGPTAVGPVACSVLQRSVLVWSLACSRVLELAAYSAFRVGQTHSPTSWYETVGPMDILSTVRSP